MGDLSDAMQDLVEDIKSSAESRHAAVKYLVDETCQFMGDVRVKISEIKSDTHNLLERFHLEHQDIADALKEKLSSDDTACREAAQQFMGDVRVDIGEIKSDTHNLLERFHSEHQDMADALKEKLSSDEAARREAAQQFMSDVRSDVAARKEAAQQFMSDVRVDIGEIKSDVHSWLDEVASDHREAREIWRKGFSGMAKETPPRYIVKEEAMKKAAPQPAAEEKAASFSEDQVLEVIAKHPDGIRLVDIGNELGADWRGLIGVTKSLVDRDKVEKIDNLYYPKS